MTTAYYSTVLNHPLQTVWDLIRDFNNYPAYIEGVSESVIEDDKGGDEVGAVRRFCYLGNWVRQRLAGHSDEGALADLCRHRAAAVSVRGVAGRARADALSRGRCTCCRSSRATGHSSNGRCTLDTAPQDAERWRTLFQSWIPDWTHSLERALGRRPSTARPLLRPRLRRPSAARRRKS